ncbi:hypothetical protein [Streptomyces sp. NPDC001415]
MSFASLSDAYWLNTPLPVRPAGACALCELLRTADSEHPTAGPNTAPTPSPLVRRASTVLLCLALAAIPTACLTALGRH